MRYAIEEIEDLSGDACHIYSLREEGSENSLFDDFIVKNSELYEDEVVDIYNRLRFIGSEGGARAGYFKLHEGKPGDGIVALYDRPDSRLRLYCIRYGSVTLIVGGGGAKPKSVRAWQEVPELARSVKTLMMISDKVYEAIKEKNIRFTEDGKLIGELTIADDEDYGQED